jgi:hypothetical protein
MATVRERKTLTAEENRLWGVCRECHKPRRIKKTVVVLHRKYVPYAIPAQSPDGIPGQMIFCEGSQKPAIPAYQ